MTANDRKGDNVMANLPIGQVADPPTRSEKKGTPAPAFFTVRQIAEDWQCSEKKVRRLIKTGELVAHRFARLIRVSAADRTAYERMNRLG